MEYTVSYRMESYYDVKVIRPAGLSAQEVIASLTFDDIRDGTPHEFGWDEVKDAWRNEDISLIYDEYGDQIF